MDNTYTGTGSYKLHHVKIFNHKDQWLNIQDVCVEIIIYESIFSKSLSGKLVIVDTKDLISNLPIIGGEKLNIKFGTAGFDESIDAEFVVYKVGDRHKNADASQVYSLMFTTTEMYNDLNRNISQRFIGSYDSIVRSILTANMKSPKSLESDSANNGDYISPLYSGFRNISYITERSFAGDNSPFLFYETLKGFNFKSLGSLYNQPISKELGVGPKMVVTDGTRDLQHEFSTILQHEYLPSCDILKLLKSNVFECNIDTYDVLNKTLSSYYTTQDNQPNIENNQMPNHVVGSGRRFKFVTPDNAQNAVQSKISMISTMDLFSLNIVVSGDSDMSVGDMINAKLPSVSRVYDKLDYDSHTSGKFLVSDIKHSIKKDAYIQHASIIKDSFTNEV